MKRAVGIMIMQRHAMPTTPQTAETVNGVVVIVIKCGVEITIATRQGVMPHPTVSGGLMAGAVK